MSLLTSQMQHLTSKVSNFLSTKILIFKSFIVLAFKIQRASGKLQKWDQMSQKISELSEQKKQRAMQKEMDMQAKLQRIQKNKEDYWTDQKTQVNERLKKWENRRQNFGVTMSKVDRKN